MAPSPAAPPAAGAGAAPSAESLPPPPHAPDESSPWLWGQPPPFLPRGGRTWPRAASAEASDPSAGVATSSPPVPSEPVGEGEGEGTGCKAGGGALKLLRLGQQAEGVINEGRELRGKREKRKRERKEGEESKQGMEMPKIDRIC